MRKVLSFLFVALVFCCWCEPLLMAGVNGEGWQEISAPEVKSMIEDGNAVVVHVLSEIEYEMQHIKGSINSLSLD